MVMGAPRAWGLSVAFRMDRNRNSRIANGGFDIRKGRFVEVTVGQFMKQPLTMGLKAAAGEWDSPEIRVPPVMSDMEIRTRSRARRMRIANIHREDF